MSEHKWDAEDAKAIAVGIVAVIFLVLFVLGILLPWTNEVNRITEFSGTVLRTNSCDHEPTVLIELADHSEIGLQTKTAGDCLVFANHIGNPVHVSAIRGVITSYDFP